MVLGDLSYGVAGRCIYFKDTYGPVCEKMGITADQFGSQPSTGKLWVHQWIGFAFKALKAPKEGMTQPGRKGRWALTDKGLAEYLRLQDGGSSFVVAATVAAASEPDLAQIQAKVIENATPGGMSLILGGRTPTDDYHVDPYIRSLAILNTRCFGNYSAKSRTCGKCPLAGRCQAKMSMDLSVLASLWRDNERRAIEEAAMPKATEVDPSTVQEPTQAELPEGADYVIAAMPSICVHCGGKVEKGARTIWLPETGTFHTTCPVAKA
jgi:hypothetical protein